MLKLKTLCDYNYIVYDQKNKTDQALLTAPVSVLSIVMGKFLAAFFVFFVAITGTLLPSVAISFFGAPNWTEILGNYVGTLLYGGAMIAIGVLSALVSLLGIVITWNNEKQYTAVCSFSIISRRNIVCSVIVKLAMIFIISGLIAKMMAFGDIVSVFFTIIASYIVYISFSSSAIAYAGRMSNMYVWSIGTTTVHTLLQLIPALDVIDSVLLFFKGKSEENPMIVEETSDIEFDNDIW